MIPPLVWTYDKEKQHYVAHGPPGIEWLLLPRYQRAGPLWVVHRDREVLGTAGSLETAKAYAERRYQQCAELRLG